MNIPDINPLDFAQYIYGEIKGLKSEALIGTVQQQETVQTKIATLQRVATWAAFQVFPEDDKQRGAYKRTCGI